VSAQPPPSEPQPGVLLGLNLIALLGVLLVLVVQAEPEGRDKTLVATGAYVMAWGVMFLLSYRFSHKTFFLRGLMFISEEFSWPKGGRYMALVYGALGVGLGVAAIIGGLVGS
jgi:hypothetical protein